MLTVLVTLNLLIFHLIFNFAFSLKSHIRLLLEQFYDLIFTSFPLPCFGLSFHVFLKVAFGPLFLFTRFLFLPFSLQLTGWSSSSRASGYFGLPVINSSGMCVCVCVCARACTCMGMYSVVSSLDYCQMLPLMASRWFQQAGCLTSGGLL